jgi:preprotein translocase subunit YajC
MALVIPLLFFVLIWVLFILPQQRRVRAHQALVATLQVGQEVMTTAGLYGVITAIDGDDLRLEVAPGIELRFTRAAVAQLATPPEAPEADAPEEVDAFEADVPAVDASVVDAPVVDELDITEPESPLPADPDVTGPVIQRRRGVLRRGPRDDDR